MIVGTNGVMSAQEQGFGLIPIMIVTSVSQLKKSVWNGLASINLMMMFVFNVLKTNVYPSIPIEPITILKAVAFVCVYGAYSSL